MPSGYSWVDPVVVLGCIIFTFYALYKRPRWMLCALPTMLTIYFFIPVVSYQTPFQIIPLILGGWVMFFDKSGRVAVHSKLIVVLVIGLLASLAYAIWAGGAGTRPYMRTLYYLSILFTFIYAFSRIRTREDLRLAMWGLVIAGAVHAGYSVYQIFAHEAGLPFRAIVRGAGGDFSLVRAYGTIRVNGLASEPKRLSYVLFAAMIAAFYLRHDARTGLRKFLLGGIGALCLIMSIFSFSASYFFAVGLTMIFLSLLSPKMLRLFVMSLLPLSLLFLTNPTATRAVYTNIETIITDRFSEVEVGLDGETVYRQEFFANDYSLENPEVALLGVGLGRYNHVFRSEYGPEAGYGGDGTILPLNSQVYEVLFDLGFIGAFLFILCPAIFLLRIGRKNRFELTLFMMTSFLLLQSLFIINMGVLAFVLGIGASYMYHRKLAKASNAQPRQRQQKFQSLPSRYRQPARSQS